jgi:hypothetical protein
VSIRFPAAVAAASASAAVGDAIGTAARRRARVMMDDDTKYCFFLGINGMRVQPEPPAGHCSAMLCQAKVATFEWHKRK